MECVLKDLIAISKDGEWGKGEQFDDSVEMLAIRGTDFEDVRFGNTASTPHRHIRKHIAERKKLQPWDVIIEAAGGTKDQITGRTVLLRPQLFSRSELPLTCASFSRFIRFNTELCDPEFMFWYLQHLYASGAMHAYHTQHTGVARFQWTTFSEREPLSLPPLPVQRRIAGILSAYDELIENNLRRIKILEEMAQNLYREWFVKFRFPGHQHFRFCDSPLGRIPEGWEVVRIKDVADVNARNIKKGEAPVEIAYVDIASVSPGSIDNIEMMAFSDAPGRARRSTRHGDVIWSSVRPNRRSFSLIIDPPVNLVVSTGFAVISAKDVPFTYLYQTVTTDDFVAYLVNHSKGAAYPAVNAEDFENASILIPSNNVLSNFDDHVLPTAVLAHRLKAKNTTLRRTRDLLLPKLISGEVDVSELDIPVPEEAEA